MLSEFCVRRPVSATMLVMSLVVLGVFSFRDLGVDLFPKADPATVNVQLALPGASPDEMSHVGRRADGRGDQRRLGHRRDAGPHLGGQGARSPSASSSSAISTMRRTTCGRRWRAPSRPRRRSCCRRSLRKSIPDADPVMSLIVSSDAMSLRTLTELTDKQIGRVIQTVNGVGEVSSGRRPRARDSHRRRHREAHVVRAVDDAGARGRGRGERRDSRRHRRAGERAAAAAHARPRRCGAGLQHHRRCDARAARRSASRISAMPKTLRAADQRRVARRYARGDARRPPCDGREHRRGHRGRPRKLDDDPPVAAARSRSPSSATTRGSSTPRSHRSRNTCSSALSSRPSS